KTYGTNLTLSATIPIREGYIFSGWNTDVNGSGTSYAASSSYNVNANVTLYAQWEAIVVNSIAVATMPTKLSYNIGENFDPTGLTLNVSMSDGSSCTITEGYECVYDAFTSSGTKTVTIRYINKEVSFSVEVVPETPDVTEFLTVTNKTVHAGEEFTVDVNIENNPGFCYLKLRLNYDSDSFEFIEAVNGTVSTDSFSSTTEALLWDSDKNATADGTLVTLKFKAKDNLAAGEYTLGIAFVEGYNYDEENITLGVNNATITVVEFIYGDVTGDNVINGKDLVRLRKYLLTLDETTGTADVEISLGADTTGDGVVNGKDLVRLRKYLLNYDEVTGTSPIVLGPTT
ncbi:MAG: InlB B-repeat-containing protein, partial [Acutalibacteraceae bacterium]